MNVNKNQSIRKTHMDQLLQFSWSFFKVVHISHYLDCLYSIYIYSMLNLRGSNANIVPSSHFVFEHGKMIL